MKKRKNAFTLIELLAIIVILAIIAVITVPIILNIIDNSSKGAATDSAYGYKDAVNKYYLYKVIDEKNYKIVDGEYTVDPETGYLIGTEETLNIQISGQTPIGGAVIITENSVEQACLQFGEYAVSIEDYKIKDTKKANCDGHEISEGEIADPELVNYTMDETCPGCNKFTKNWDDNKQLINQPLTVDATDSYTSYGNLFFGFVVKNNIVKRAFVCGITNENVICIEGNNADKYSRNIEILEHFFNYCEESASIGFNCINPNDADAIYYHMSNNGFVNIGEPGNADCRISPTTHDVFCY